MYVRARTQPRGNEDDLARGRRYEKLKAHKREGERFSDVVRRLTGGVKLAEYHGVLDEETAVGLEAVVENRREERSSSHRERVSGITDRLDE